MFALLLASTSAGAALLLGGAALAVFFPLVPRDLGGAANLNARARRVRVPVGDGDALDGWHLEGDRDSVVIVFHGFGRDHHRAWRYAAFLNAAGHHIVTVDFRSSRLRGRKPTTLGVFECEDAQATLDWVRREPGLANARVGLFGESLGGAVAILTASRNPGVAAVVADGAFANALDALEDSCERWARVPRQPSAAILRSMARWTTGHDPADRDVVPAAAGLRERPLFLIHAERDNRISTDQALRLWRAAGAKDPLWLIPDAGHNQGWIRHRALYEQRVTAFFASHLLGEGPGLAPGELQPCR